LPLFRVSFAEWSRGHSGDESPHSKVHSAIWSAVIYHRFQSYRCPPFPEAAESTAD